MSLPPSIDANLVNLSAMGIRFQAAMPLEVGEPVTIRLSGEASQPLVTCSGTVRWVRPDDHGGWLAGCLFDQRVEWEVLGELFLAGVLTTDRPEASPAETALTETPALPH